MHRIGCLGFLLCTAIGAAGCQDPRGPARVESDDPDLKITAIKHDVSAHDQRDVAKMVDDLESDDAAVRFYSIQGLRRLTHDDFGYRFYDNDDKRAPAVTLWKKWLKQQQKKWKFPL